MTFGWRAVVAAGLAAAVAGGALAQETAHDRREAFMKSMARQAGPMFDMAQGKAPYDAAAARAAAAELASLAAQDFAPLFPAGSDMVTLGKGRALPKIWEDMDGVMARHEVLVKATAALALVAGDGPDALKGAIGAVGAACGGCHETYRAPQ